MAPMPGTGMLSNAKLQGDSLTTSHLMQRMGRGVAFRPKTQSFKGRLEPKKAPQCEKLSLDTNPMRIQLLVASLGSLYAVRVTPPPCNGTDATACPYYFHQPADAYYEVLVNSELSFVYQSIASSQCKSGKCASDWNVKSQSFTMASASFSGGVQVVVRFGKGRLAGKAFSDPKVVSRFGSGNPIGNATAPHEYTFVVTAPGHYSVELFGQHDLSDALLVFLDDQETEPPCPEPQSKTGKQYRFVGPNVNNPPIPSWKNTGYYKFDNIKLKEDDVVCVERGAYVVGHFMPSASRCRDHRTIVQGQGIISGDVTSTPADERRKHGGQVPHSSPSSSHNSQLTLSSNPLILSPTPHPLKVQPLVQLCGTDATVRDVTFVNSLGSNLEINPYWYTAYTSTDQSILVHSVYWYTACTGTLPLLVLLAAYTGTARCLYWYCSLPILVLLTACHTTSVVYIVHCTSHTLHHPLCTTHRLEETPGTRRLGSLATNVKVLSTWWYSTDGIYVGPSGKVGLDALRSALTY
jgi:hypothetical protein